MADTDPLSRTGAKLSRLLSRARASLQIPRAPDYATEPVISGREEWLRQLARERYALECARDVLVRDGWTSGGWFTVRQPGVSGSGDTVRTVGSVDAFGFLGPQAGVVSACLVGTLLRMADDPDQAPTTADVWGCVDELYEAMHEQLGHVSFPPGRAYPMEERRTRLRGLTTWNDAPGRTREQVVDVVDRAVARTIVAACR